MTSIVPGFLISVTGMGGEAWPRRFRGATISNARKHWIGQGRSEKESSMPRASRTSAALAFEREKLTDIGGIFFRRACGSAAGAKRGGDLSVPARGSAREGADLGGGGLLLDLGF